MYIGFKFNKHTININIHLAVSLLSRVETNRYFFESKNCDMTLISVCIKKTMVIIFYNREALAKHLFFKLFCLCCFLPTLRYFLLYFINSNATS